MFQCLVSSVETPTLSTSSADAAIHFSFLLFDCVPGILCILLDSPLVIVPFSTSLAKIEVSSVIKNPSNAPLRTCLGGIRSDEFTVLITSLPLGILLKVVIQGDLISFEF